MIPTQKGSNLMTPRPEAKAFSFSRFHLGLSCKERPQLVGIGTDPGLVDKAGVKRPGGKRAGKTPRKDVKDETSRSSVVIHQFYQSLGLCQNFLN